MLHVFLATAGQIDIPEGKKEAGWGCKCVQTTQSTGGFRTNRAFRVPFQQAHLPSVQSFRYFYIQLHFTGRANSVVLELHLIIQFFASNQTIVCPAIRDDDRIGVVRTDDLKLQLIPFRWNCRVKRRKDAFHMNKGIGVLKHFFGALQGNKKVSVLSRMQLIEAPDLLHTISPSCFAEQVLQDRVSREITG